MKSFKIGRVYLILVLTTTQAVVALKRSKGMVGIVMIGDDGQACIAFHDCEYKDGGKKLNALYRQWEGN